MAFQGEYISDVEIKNVATGRWYNRMFDQDSDGNEETGKLERAISSAETEFESYAATNYDISALRALAPTPRIVVDVCVDLAIHAGAQMDEGAMTTAIRRRYEDRLSWLIKLAKGIVKLPVPDSPDALGDGNAARLVALPRQRTRVTMERL